MRHLAAFQNTFAARLQDLHRGRVEAVGSHTPAGGFPDQRIALHLKVLELFPSWVASLAPDDPRLLSMRSLTAPRGSLEDWPASGAQYKLLATVGMSERAPYCRECERQRPPLTEPGEILEHLVVAAAHDLIDFQRFQLETVREEAKAQLAAETEAAQRLAHEQAQAVVDKAHADQAAAVRAELDQTRAELAAERRHLMTLRALLSEAGIKEPAKGERPARRTRVDGEPHVYQRANSKGEVVYEVGYRKDGRQAWKTTGPELSAAVELRDKLRDEGVIAPDPVEAAA